MECAELPLHALLQLACGKKNIGYYFILLLHILRIPIFYLDQVHYKQITIFLYHATFAPFDVRVFNNVKIDLVLEIDLVLLLV